MGTLNAIYVRATRSQSELLRMAYPRARTERGREFYVVEQPRTEFNPPEDELAGLSARLDTDVLWVSFQSAADAFRFHHWRAGKHLRALIYAYEEQGVWERVEGEPEPWEHEAFFSSWQLESALADASKKEAASLRRVWRDATLVVGQTVPFIAGREAAQAVAEYYHLPGWS